MQLLRFEGLQRRQIPAQLSHELLQRAEPTRTDRVWVSNDSAGPVLQGVCWQHLWASMPGDEGHECPVCAEQRGLITSRGRMRFLRLLAALGE